MLEFQLNDMKREDEERARAEEKQSEKLIAEILKSEGFDVGEQDEQGSQEEGFGNFSLKILKHSVNFEVLNFFSTNSCEPGKENELYCKFMYLPMLNQSLNQFVQNIRNDTRSAIQNCC